MDTTQIIWSGALPDPIDIRDYPLPLGAIPVDWEKGYNIEKEIDFKLPSKNQGKSLSCVGQALAYYVGILNKIETGIYDECSAKSIYSRIFLPSGGAYIRDGADLLVNSGALYEKFLTSYNNGNPPDETFMRDLSWLKPEIDKLAKVLQAKEYRVITSGSIDAVAQAIRDNNGVVFGFYGDNNGTWFSPEPKIPTNKDWAHAMYGGKFRLKNGKKQIGAKNSWGNIGEDGWQWFGEEWFGTGYSFNPWTLTDKINYKENNMITYKKIGSPAVYFAVGSKLIPFATTWENYLKDFADAILVELSEAEFAKFQVAQFLEVKAK